MAIRTPRRIEANDPDEALNEAMLGEFDDVDTPDKAGIPMAAAVPKAGTIAPGLLPTPDAKTLDASATGVPATPAPGAAPAAPAATPPAAARPAPTGPINYDLIEGTENQAFDASSPHLSGFNTAEWGPGGSEGYDEFSYKNNFGKIASIAGAPTPDRVRSFFSGDDAAAQAFRQTYPRAELIDHPTDPKIRFEPGDEPVDVLIKSGEGGWGWQPEGGPNGAAGGGANPLGASSVVGSIDDLAEGGDLQAQIQKAIAATARGEDPFLDEAIAQEFR